MTTTARINDPAALTAKAGTIRREQERLRSAVPYTILVCTGGGCIASGSLALRDALQEELKKQHAEKQATILSTGCLGPCVKGPVLVIQPDNVFYQNVALQDAAEIVSEHIKNSRPITRLMVAEGPENRPVPHVNDIEFFKRQTKIVLRNCGRIDPLQIDDYIAADGYQALAKVIAGVDPDNVIDEVKKSGLRGRGGAGFSTGMKWSFTKKAPGEIKYVLCNADEGDPGAFMDRSVLEGDPHSVIEGMAVAAYAVGAKQGYVYVRAEYPLAVERLTIAIKQARECGLLGAHILGTGFCFDLEIRMGSGAFVCGEETALITSIEGNRGEPRSRPPFPAQKGLWGKPTLLNNVETYANIPAIILKGAGWYAAFGTAKSKGTKVFALAGAVNNTGLVEVPIGTSLGELIYDVGGGIKDNKGYKAAQIGGPSGGCIPRQNLNVALDYESLNELGAIMGSGGLIVMDENTCMVDVARFFLEFVQDESCGKCVPCRVGTKRMLEILERICAGEGQEGDVERLIELGEMIKTTALCGLGQTAPNPVLSTIRHFRHEYDAHIRDKHCDAAVCAGLVRAPCQSACPAEVDIPGFVALTAEKRYSEALRLHRERNPFAAVCARVCFHTCEFKCRRSSIDAPVSIRGVKRFLVDQEKTVQLPDVRENGVNAKRKIAVVGAGPAGLSCAYFLARLGYRPTVFEAEPRPGGMLVQTIPAYRLPREVLAREVRMIEQMGVTIATGKRLGMDFTLAGLKDDGVEAVFLGIGAQDPVRLNIPGEATDGVVDALDFLRQYNLRGSVPVGRRVVVVGGGNAAIDAARTAIRLGSQAVTILYRRTREEMPAYAEEIEEALQEGVALQLLTAPVAVVIDRNKVGGIRCRPMHLGEFDSSGRRRPEGDEGGDVVIACDQIITAIGQRVDVGALLEGVALSLTNAKTIAVERSTGRTSVPWIFAGGDAASGAASVVEAIAAGERAAIGIDTFLTGGHNGFWRTQREVQTTFDPDADPVPYNREKLPLIAVDRRANNFDEVELCWTESVSMRQSQRCLRCDYGKTIPAERSM
jgi:NADH-quinone oxidoreductase subunit F